MFKLISQKTNLTPSDQIQSQKTQSSFENLGWIYLANFLYGFAGTAFCAYIGLRYLPSFLIGWTIAFVNFVLLRKIGGLLLQGMHTNKYSPKLFILLLAKFSFWGCIIAVLSTSIQILAVPFILGSLTIVFSGLSLSVKEIFAYART